MKLYPRGQYLKDKPINKWEWDCVFCFLEREPEYVIWRGKYFYVKHNKYPYLWQKDHLLVIPYRHVCLTKDLLPEEYLEMLDVEKFLSEYYGEKKYFSFIRENGNFKSMNHLHYHYLPGEVCDQYIEAMLESQGFIRPEL